MPRPSLQVSVDHLNDSAAIAGPGAGKLIQRAGGKLMWSRTRRSWMTNVQVAADVLAIADHESRWHVTYDESGPT